MLSESRVNHIRMMTSEDSYQVLTQIIILLRLDTTLFLNLFLNQIVVGLFPTSMMLLEISQRLPTQVEKKSQGRMIV